MIGQLFTSTGSILVHNKVVHFPSNLSLYIAFPFQILVAYLWKVSVLLCSIIVYNSVLLKKNEYAVHDPYGEALPLVQ